MGMAKPSHAATTVLILVSAALVGALAAAAPAGASSGGGGRRRGEAAGDDVLPRPPPLTVGVTAHCTGWRGVRAGEKCSSVARDAGMSAPVFRQFNPNITCSALFPGQWVCVNGYLLG